MARKVVFCIAAGLDFESGLLFCTSYKGRCNEAEKVAYEAEDFHRVVARTGPIAGLCEAENRDESYASAAVP
jgi:hypothetical protein